MTYTGLGSILFRFVGVILIGAVLVFHVPAIALESSASIRSQLLMSSGLLLLPGVILIVASKPLGKFLAAGIE